jgi:hypothetical protein
MVSCRWCGAEFENLTEPLQIQWQPGSDRMGDFSVCAGQIVVLPEVRIFLENNNYRCRFRETEVVAPEARKRNKVVPFPYEGPPLTWIEATDRVSLDVERSGVRLMEGGCTEGIYEYKYDGLVMRREAFSGEEKMFLISQFKCGSPSYITEPALEELLAQGFANLHYEEAGIIV